MFTAVSYFPFFHWSSGFLALNFGAQKREKKEIYTIYFKTGPPGYENLTYGLKTVLFECVETVR